MQWTPPGGAPKNDGTDLWRSTLSGVPQPAKPQPSTPWGNHTPANPADYKEWGREDGGMGDNMPGNGPAGDNDNMWTPGSGPGSSGSGGGGQVWPDQERRDDRPAQFNDRDQGPNWGGESQSLNIYWQVWINILSQVHPSPKMKEWEAGTVRAPITGAVATMPAMVAQAGVPLLPSQEQEQVAGEPGQEDLLQEADLASGRRMTVPPWVGGLMMVALVFGAARHQLDPCKQDPLAVSTLHFIFHRS